MRNIYKKKKPGAILVMIIGIIFLLGFIVTEYLSLVTDEIRRKSDTTGNYFLKIETYNALELTLAYLTSIQEVEKGLFGPKQGWNDLPLDVVRDPEESDMLQTKVTLIDESGKIGLRKPNKELLNALFRELKLDDGVAQELTDSFIDWVSKKEQKTPFNTFSDFYADQELPYFAASIALITYDNLRYIKGFPEHFFDEAGNPNEIFAKFKEATSLYNDDGINLNTAPPVVVETLSRLTGVSKAEFTSLLWGPDEEPGTKDDLVLRDAKKLMQLMDKKYHSLIQVSPSYLKINIATNFGERLHTLNLLMSVKNKKEATQGEKQNPQGGKDKEVPAGQAEKKEKGQDAEMKLLLMQENQPLE